MLEKTRIRSIVLISSAVLISIVASIGHGQTRSRLNAPKELLDVLDPDDRNCVVTNGGLSKSVSVQPIQLAADRSRQILVRGSGLCLCGAQNCGFWIYRKTGNRNELLLKGTGSTKVRAGQKSAKGYRDVISESHASANETILRTYRYDGAQYQLQSCVNRAYYDDNGNYVKKPIDRPCEGETKRQAYVTVPASVLDTLNVTFPVAWENIGFSESLSRSANGPGAVSVIPQIFIIDKEGRIRKYFKGYNRANTMPSFVRNCMRLK